MKEYLNKEGFKKYETVEIAVIKFEDVIATAPKAGSAFPKS